MPKYKMTGGASTVLTLTSLVLGIIGFIILMVFVAQLTKPGPVDNALFYVAVGFIGAGVVLMIVDMLKK